MNCFADPKTRETIQHDGLDFLKLLVQQTIQHLEHRERDNTPIRQTIATAELSRLLDCFDDKIAEPSDNDDLLAICTEIIRFSVRTAHPNFISQIYSKADLYGIAAEFLVAALNNNVHVFQLAPALSVIEKDLISYLARTLFLDRENTQEIADGIFVPGSSYGNLVALFVAMISKEPDIADNGLGAVGKPCVVFCSENAHYSIDKVVMLLGLGRANLCKIPCDTKGRMRVDQLQRAIAQSLADDKMPIAIVATSGTTVLSAFDPLPEISVVARSNGLWLHVDAAWGGAAAFSSTHSRLLDGITHADSLVFSAHKMLGAPIQCAAMLVHGRHKGLLQAAASVDAPYLYQNSPDVPDKEPDLSRSTFQCGRRSDALKLWLMMHAHGAEGFERKVDGCAAWAQEISEELQHRHNLTGAFQIYQQTFSTVCFWYAPKAIRALDFSNLDENADPWRVLDELPALVRETLIRGEHPMLVSYGNAKGVPAFFRLGLSNFPASKAQRKASTLNILDTIERVAEQILAGEYSTKITRGLY